MIRELNTGEEQLHSYLRIVDLLIEVRDARVPASCEDPLFERLASRRERVLVLSQADLACPDTTARWCMVLGKQGYPVFHMDLKHGTGLGVLKNYFKRFPGKRSRRSRRRSLPGGSQPLRAMVIGVPNTGKSSLINRLAGHRRARVGAQPGITRGPQWIKISRGLELLDTPGLLNPKTDQITRTLLAITGSVPIDTVDIEELVDRLIKTLPPESAGKLYAMAGMADSIPLTQILLDNFAIERNCLLPGGKPDRHRAAMAIIRLFRKGDLGRCTLDQPAANNETVENKV